MITVSFISIAFVVSNIRIFKILGTDKKFHFFCNLEAPLHHEDGRNRKN